ncbi:hypothetical protein NDN08_002557 [Rhodosorus marinus]|uniref:Transcriptional regulatory protein n=1 Tax=Rhodosorus marinus TaxID=101924 RepID=A0AAV8UWR4_9RHOD|nr:hypothetical protein NDN08_002557 [Rhodosorus marinus]
MREVGFVGLAGGFGTGGNGKVEVCGARRASERASRGRSRVVMMGRRSEKIKGRKEKQDRAKVKVYARIGKLITAAVKSGGAEAETNKGLADVLELARASNVPKDNVERAIQRAASKDQADYKESTFEVYGHGGVGIIVDVLTDNNNRAASEIRAVVNKHNLKIASPGSVGFNFDRKGVIRIRSELIEDFDEFFLEAAEAGAEDCLMEDEICTVITEVQNFDAVRKVLIASGLSVDSSALELIPKTTVTIEDADADKNTTAIELLEDIDDVDAVFSNMED